MLLLCVVDFFFNYPRNDTPVPVPSSSLPLHPAMQTLKQTPSQIALGVGSQPSALASPPPRAAATIAPSAVFLKKRSTQCPAVIIK